MPIRTTVPLKEGYLGFHVSLGECRIQGLAFTACGVWQTTVGLQVLAEGPVGAAYSNDVSK